jgi:hypothetical protein
MSPLLEKEDLISYADDKYLIRGNKNKETVLQRLQFQIQKANKFWSKRQHRKDRYSNNNY